MLLNNETLVLTSKRNSPIGGWANGTPSNEAKVLPL